MTAGLTITISIEALQMLSFLLVLQLSLWLGYKAWQEAHETEDFAPGLYAAPYGVGCLVTAFLALAMLGKWYIHLPP